MKSTLAPSNTAVTNRDPKGRKFMDIVAAAYDKAGLSDGPKGEAQRINNAYLGKLSDLITNFIEKCRFREDYANEEVESTYSYLSGYTKPADLNAQCNQLRILFPGIGFANPDLQMRIKEGVVKLPPEAEGWFAIPNWRKRPEVFGNTYSEAVLKILDTINKTRDGKVWNYRDGELDEKHLRQSARSEQFWVELAKTQGDEDVLIVAAQFGLRHRGRSVRRARVVMEDSGSELGLGAFAVASMLLTHPARLQHYDDLWIDCAGDEWSSGGDGAFLFSTHLRFFVGKVEFDKRDIGGTGVRWGTASTFSLQ